MTQRALRRRPHHLQHVRAGPGPRLLPGRARARARRVLVRVPHSSGMLEGRYTADTVFGENDHRRHRTKEWLEEGLQKLDDAALPHGGTRPHDRPGGAAVHPRRSRASPRRCRTSTTRSSSSSSRRRPTRRSSRPAEMARVAELYAVELRRCRAAGRRRRVSDGRARAAANRRRRNGRADRARGSTCSSSSTRSIRVARRCRPTSARPRIDEVQAVVEAMSSTACRCAPTRSSASAATPTSCSGTSATSSSRSRRRRRGCSSTRIGPYLTTPYAFLAMTRKSAYVDKTEPESAASRRLTISPGTSKYLFVYPFVKTRPWYNLPQEKRQEMMDTHIRIGRKYPSVKLNTTYSFGLDDQEFVVSFETDEPGDFLDLVMELRETETSLYTLRDTPTFTCVATTVRGMLDVAGRAGARPRCALRRSPRQTASWTRVCSLEATCRRRHRRRRTCGGEQVAMFNVRRRLLRDRSAMPARQRAARPRATSSARC